MGQALPYIGAVVGGVVGYFVGNPILGAEIGYSIGSVVEASNEKIVTEGPRLNDLRTSFSSNGAWITRIYVHAGGIGGNFIWATPLTPAEHEASSSGKGGPTSVNKTTTYSASFRARICESNGDREVVRIWANGILIWSRTPDADAATLIASAELVGKIIIYNGADDQLPDPTMESVLGIGNVPAHIGYLDVVFVDFQLANYSNNIEATQLTYEVVEALPQDIEKPLLVSADGFLSMLDDKGLWFFKNNASNLSVQNTGRGSFSGDVYLDALDGSGPQRQASFRTVDFNRPFVYFVPNTDPQQYELRLLPGTDFGGVVIGPKAAVWRLGGGYHLSGSNAVYDGDQTIRFYLPTGTIDTTDGALPAAPIVGELSALPLVAFRNVYPDATGGGGGGDSGGDTIGQGTRHLAAMDGALYAFAESVATGSNAHASWIGFTSTVVDDASHTSVSGEASLTFSTQRVCGLRIATGKLYVLLEGDYNAGTFAYTCQVFDLLHNHDLLATWIGPRWAFAPPIFDLFVVGAELDVVAGTALRWKWNDAGTLVVGDLTPPPGAHGATAGETRTIAWQGPQ